MRPVGKGGGENCISVRLLERRSGSFICDKAHKAMNRTTETAVCIIVENLPVPLDRRVWKEACALRDAGYRVSVICPKGKGHTTSYETLDGIEIYRHKTWEASRKLEYFLEYGWALIAEFLLALRVFARTRFSILQACNPPDNIFLIGLFFRLFGVRFIFDQHDLGPELFEAKFGNHAGTLYKLACLLERCSYRVANTCITTNESFREIAIARGGKDPKSVFVVRNCPDLDKFRRPQIQTPNKFGREFLVAYVGFMGSQDGLDILLDSIEHIVKHDHRTDTHFLLIGGGSMLPELQAIVAEKNLSGFVTLTGQVTHSEVAAYLASADLGVAPDPKNAMNDISTMIKIFEYMAFELPVVLFDLKEGRRTAGPAALYAVPNDPIDFANRITELLDSSALRQQLGECGRKRIEENLNWQVEKLTLLRAYESAAQSGRVLRELRTQ
jgi:glycosyltransferase involved in cell wall biosynthesis